MSSPSLDDDLKTLSDSLCQLLSGELKVGTGLLRIGSAWKRQGRNKQWVQSGLSRWIDEHEEALPLIAAALGASGVERLKAWTEKAKPPL